MTENSQKHERVFGPTKITSTLKCCQGAAYLPYLYIPYIYLHRLSLEITYQSIRKTGARIRTDAYWGSDLTPDPFRARIPSMDNWQPRISEDRALTLINLFFQLKLNREVFLDSDLIEPITRREIYALMDWFEKAYDRRQALVAVEEKWGKNG